MATAADRQQGIRGQTEQCLAALDKSLAEAGTDRRRILSAQIFLADMATKAEMDAVWNAWIGAQSGALAAAGLRGRAPRRRLLVEIILTAART